MRGPKQATVINFAVVSLMIIRCAVNNKPQLYSDCANRDQFWHCSPEFGVELQLILYPLLNPFLATYCELQHPLGLVGVSSVGRCKLHLTFKPFCYPCSLYFVTRTHTHVCLIYFLYSLESVRGGLAAAVPLLQSVPGHRDLDTQRGSCYSMPDAVDLVQLTRAASQTHRVPL